MTKEQVLACSYTRITGRFYILKETAFFIGDLRALFCHFAWQQFSAALFVYRRMSSEFCGEEMKRLWKDKVLF
jgi:hypothetical protein